MEAFSFSVRKLGNRIIYLKSSHPASKIAAIRRSRRVLIFFTKCYYHSQGTNPFKCHEEVLSLQPMTQPKRFDISPPLTGGCSEGLDALVQIFL